MQPCADPQKFSTSKFLSYTVGSPLIILITVLGVILEMAGLGFVSVAYSVYLEDQVGVAVALLYRWMKLLCTHASSQCRVQLILYSLA